MLGSRWDFLFDHTLSVRLQLVNRSFHLQLAIHMRDGLVVEILEHDAKLQGIQIYLKAMHLRRDHPLGLYIFIGNVDDVSGKQNVGIDPFLSESSIIGMVPYNMVVAEFELLGDTENVIALLDSVVLRHGLHPKPF